METQEFLWPLPRLVHWLGIPGFIRDCKYELDGRWIEIRVNPYTGTEITTWDGLCVGFDRLTGHYGGGGCGFNPTLLRAATPFSLLAGGQKSGTPQPPQIDKTWRVTEFDRRGRPYVKYEMPSLIEFVEDRYPRLLADTSSCPE